MNGRTRLVAIAMLGIRAAACDAQTANPFAGVSGPAKQIDIGAAEAPLSDLERADLDTAVRKHSYSAEKAVMDKAMNEHPDSFELLVMAGRLAYFEKQPKDAVAALERADKVGTLSEQDRMTLAIAYQFSGQPARSRTELVRLTTLGPKNAEYPRLLGQLDLLNHHPEDAAREFAAAIALDPDFVRAYEDLGQVYQQLGRVDEARKTYETGAEVNRRLTIHWEWSPLDLGVVLLKANEFPGAEKLFAEALQYKPRFAWGHYYMGQLRQKQGRDLDATNEYKEAVVDDPRLRQAWLALAQEFTRQNNKTEADKCMAIFKRLEEGQNALQEKK
jgi:tetratricopeptide (TPR) repeat protein